MTDNDMQKNQDEFGHPGGLIGAILQQSLNNAHESGMRRHEYEKDRADKLEATLDAIRWNIQTLFDGPYQPSATAVLMALWPDDQDITNRTGMDMD